jgi:uncharacterized SAM-binding protein YcdF (DUF218 family)
MFLFLSKSLDLLFAPLTWALSLLAVGWTLRRRTTLAWSLVAFAATELFVFSTQPVADYLMRWTEATAPRTFVADRTYDAVIVLGGVMEQRGPWMDNGRDLSGAAERLTRAFEVLRAGQARNVLLSGGLTDPPPGMPSEADQLAVMLKGWGVPPDRITVEPRSRNTYENAVESARIVGERGWRRVLLVTSAAHMPRALGCFRRAGLTPDALPVDYRGGSAAAGASWWPRASDLGLSTDALRELAGRMVYRLKGYTVD